MGAACTLSPGRSRRQGLRSALSQPYPCLGHPDAAALQPRGAHTLSRASGTGQERRANASAACPQPLTGVFQVTEAAHLHPSLIITAWWPGVQAPVWSTHNASGVETSRQAPASLCFRRRGDQGHHPGVTCAATGRGVRDPARALAPRTEKRAHHQPHGAPPTGPREPKTCVCLGEAAPHPAPPTWRRRQTPAGPPDLESQPNGPTPLRKTKPPATSPCTESPFPGRAPGIEAWTPDWGPGVSRRPQSLGYTTPRNICGGAFGNCYTHLQTLNSA